jgi:hypothetical protein
MGYAVQISFYLGGGLGRVGGGKHVVSGWEPLVKWFAPNGCYARGWGLHLARPRFYGKLHLSFFWPPIIACNVLIFGRCVMSISPLFTMSHHSCVINSIKINKRLNIIIIHLLNIESQINKLWNVQHSKLFGNIQPTLLSTYIVNKN